MKKQKNIRKWLMIGAACLFVAGLVFYIVRAALGYLD